ncbi:MAG: trypsin-like peptidase domain-containing protein [Oscillospiraceae bacterium]
MYYNDYNRQNDHWDDGRSPLNDIPPDPSMTQPIFQKKKRVWPRVVALALAVVLLGGGAGVGGALLTNRLTTGNTTLYQGDRAPTVVNISKLGTNKVLTIPEVYASNVNSVVGVTVDFITTNYFGQTVSAAAAGSGFVISNDGYILTNYHVISNNGTLAKSIKVSFVDGTSYEAQFIGGQEENDIAVLKAKDAKNLQPVIFGSSEDMKVGEAVVAIGNPLGELTFTLTEGVVSAKDRNISMSDGTVMNMIQTNAAINSGNSGGPLFNTYGEVIGITSAKFSNNGSAQASIEGIGFAIPINDVAGMVKDIMQNGYVTGKPYMGITVRTVGTDAQQYGIPAGAYVQAVAADTCAAKAGLKSADVITKIDDVAVDSSATLIAEKNKHKAGDTVKLEVTRGQEKLTLTLTFDESTPESDAKAQADLERQEKALQEQQKQEQNQQNQQNVPQYPGNIPWPFGDMFGW